jgi:hypothetical protein
MRSLRLSSLLAGAAVVLFIAGCSDSTAPANFEAADGVRMATAASEEFDRYIFSKSLPGELTVRYIPEDSVWYPFNADDYGQLEVYPFGGTGPAAYRGAAVYAWVDVNLVPSNAADTVYRGALWSMAEKDADNRHGYNVYYRFDLYTRGENARWIGSFSAREQPNCPRLPCAPKSTVEFIAGSGAGVFAGGFDGYMNTPNSILDKYGDDYLIYVDLGGRLSWGGSGDPPSDDAPVASFVYDCGNTLTCAFTDTSLGRVLNRSWSFGDGATSTAQNPSHTYPGAGRYTVSLTVTDGADPEQSSTASAIISCTTHPKQGTRCK